MGLVRDRDGTTGRAGESLETRMQRYEYQSDFARMYLAVATDRVSDAAWREIYERARHVASLWHHAHWKLSGARWVSRFQGSSPTGGRYSVQRTVRSRPPR